MIDYVLNVAVGISAGVGALISAVPSLQPSRLTLCIVILILLTFVNLRGIREAGTLFIVPICVFIVSLFTIILWGLVAMISSGGHPLPVVSPAPLANTTEAVGAWVLLRAFATGCTAMTGVEAVSNGVQAFREPAVPAARRTLGAIIAILMVLLLGIAYLAHAHNTGATEPEKSNFYNIPELLLMMQGEIAPMPQGASNYQSVLSQLTGAVAGRGIVYWISMASILLVLCLSANTSFADFPRLCRSVAEDGCLPGSFSNQGRRLGVTDRLIPVFAFGAFMAFTLSQIGMVAHWWNGQERGALVKAAVNGLGATGTGITLEVMAVVKFVAGAWIVVGLLPSLVGLMLLVRRHYRRIEREIAADLTWRKWSGGRVIIVWRRISP
jgi:amino acid transporter